MTHPADILQPPRLAVWLISLFAPVEDSQSIAGDLLEEFSCFAAKEGVAFARRWYWRQTVKSLTHLFGRGFRSAPWSTIAAVAGGFLLLRFVSGLPGMLLSALTDRYLAFWSTHFQAYSWMLKGMLPAHLIAIMFVGAIVALVAKGREMVATMMLALVLSGLIGAAFVWVGMHRPLDVSWILSSSAEPLVIVMSGALVRTRRSAAASLRSAA
jgi:hypothetical protein